MQTKQMCWKSYERNGKHEITKLSFKQYKLSNNTTIEKWLITHRGRNKKCETILQGFPSHSLIWSALQGFLTHFWICTSLLTACKMFFNSSHKLYWHHNLNLSSTHLKELSNSNQLKSCWKSCGRTEECIVMKIQHETVVEKRLAKNEKYCWHWKLTQKINKNFILPHDFQHITKNCQTQLSLLCIENLARELKNVCNWCKYNIWNVLKNILQAMKNNIDIGNWLGKPCMTRKKERKKEI